MATSNLTCSIDGCGRISIKRGWCNMHYKRWTRHGDPLVASRFYDIKETLAARTEWLDDCLIWTGQLTPKGYARARVNGAKTMVHRYVWERDNGPIPDGLFIDHRCHNRACLNVKHLRLATNKLNLENQVSAHAGNRSKVRGVTWDSKSGKWIVRAIHNSARHYGGSFNVIAEAEVAAIALRNSLFTYNDADRF